MKILRKLGIPKLDWDNIAETTFYGFIFCLVCVAIFAIVMVMVIHLQWWILLVFGALVSFYFIGRWLTKDKP